MEITIRYPFSLLVCAAFLLASSAPAQSGVVDNLGAVTAAKMAGAVGFNLQSTNPVEFTAAASLGSTHARLDSCGWTYTQTSNVVNNATVEIQSAPPNNTSGGYQLPPNCLAGITAAVASGQKPTIVLAYGAPTHQICQVTVSSNVAAGAYTIPISFSSCFGGLTFAALRPFYDWVAENGVTLTTRTKNEGSLVIGVSLTDSTDAVLTLAAATSATVASGTTLKINEELYPPAQNGSPTDPSVVAYTNMAAGVAALVSPQVGALGAELELWNEPTWGPDCWDNVRNCYDYDPGTAGEIGTNGSNFGFVAALQHITLPSNITAIWAGTEKAASNYLPTSARMNTQTGQYYIENQAQTTYESLHFYGNQAEDSLWNQRLLAANPSCGTACNILPNGSGYYLAESNTLIDRAANGPTYGIHHDVTETGTSISYIYSEERKATFIDRQLWVIPQDDVDYMEIYRLYDYSDGSTDTGYSLITPLVAGAPCGSVTCATSTTFTALPAYTALAGAMAAVKSIARTPPASYTLASLSSVSSYSGTYPLAIMHNVGAFPGDTANTDLAIVYQLSTTGTSNCLGGTGGSGAGCWGLQAAPAAVPVTFALETGKVIRSAVDSVTRAAVTFSGSTVSAVSDHPIEVMIGPPVVASTGLRMNGRHNGKVN